MLLPASGVLCASEHTAADERRRRRRRGRPPIEIHWEYLLNFKPMYPNELTRSERHTDMAGYS